MIPNDDIIEADAFIASQEPTNQVPQKPRTPYHRPCVAHHHACDCREAQFQRALKTLDYAESWASLTDAGLRLRLGELTAQEIRNIRAVLAAITIT